MSAFNKVRLGGAAVTSVLATAISLGLTAGPAASATTITTGAAVAADIPFTYYRTFYDQDRRPAIVQCRNAGVEGKGLYWLDYKCEGSYGSDVAELYVQWIENL
ncbi:hypothetical protein ACIBI9_67100 [Nonomuraea sp. NPDC050451]|uniref:hypothetical protein n=1 Tax=Nonomuraea sp. NPDC050451 TaxID=3364364 RepID=UPI0037B0A718